MRPSLLLTLTLLAAAFSLHSPAAQAQPQAPATPESLLAVNSATAAAVLAPAPIPANDPTEGKPATVLLTGRVLSPAGRLPGAVVTLTGTKLKAVTNENGEFNLSVPAGSATMSLTTSYAGFLDETVTLLPDAAPLTLSLTRPQAIKVARRQQLKAYLKTARKQVKKQVKRTRKGR